VTENVLDATYLALIIYAMAAAVSFLVACIIRMTFAAIRLHSSRAAAPAEAQVKKPEQARTGSGN